MGAEPLQDSQIVAQLIRSSLIAEYGSTGQGCQSCSWSAEQEEYIFPFPVRVREFGFTRQLQPFCLVSVCSFSTVRLNLVLIHGLPPAFLSATIPIF